MILREKENLQKNIFRTIFASNAAVLAKASVSP